MRDSDRIFVADHRGMVGSAVCRALGLAGFGNVVTRTHAELDLLDPRAVRAFYEAERPDVAVIAAARVGGIGAKEKGTDPGKMGTGPVSHIEKERFERKKLRFEQEARLLAGLNSPHFPSFYAFGEAHGYVYLAEELLEPGELPRGDRPRAKYVARRVPLPPSVTSPLTPLPQRSVAGIGCGTG